MSLEDFRREVQSLIDGDDIKIVRSGPGPSGWEDFVWLACGKSKAFVFRLHDKPGPSVDRQMKSVLPNLRKREAERLSFEEVVNSTVARFYVSEECH